MDIFPVYLVAGAHDGGLVFLDCRISLLLSIVDQIEGGVKLPEVGPEHFGAVVFPGTVRLLDRQLIVQIPPHVRRIIFLVGKHLVADSLDMGILGGVNLEAPAVEQGISLSLVITGGEKVFHDIVS